MSAAKIELCSAEIYNLPTVCTLLCFNTANRRCIYSLSQCFTTLPTYISHQCLTIYIELKPVQCLSYAQL